MKHFEILTKKQIDNLEKAAKWIRENVTQDRFNMRHYYDHPKIPLWEKGQPSVSLNECGTTGCFLGWCPSVPGLEFAPGEVAPYGDARWDEYEDRIFNLPSGLWVFCFSEYWSLRDPSIEGAVFRAEYLVNLCKKGDRKILEVIEDTLRGSEGSEGIMDVCDIIKYDQIKEQFLMERK